jgi:uncharacterized membrane protein YhdT
LVDESRSDGHLHIISESDVRGLIMRIMVITQFIYGGKVMGDLLKKLREGFRVLPLWWQMVVYGVNILFIAICLVYLIIYLIRG